MEGLAHAIVGAHEELQNERAKQVGVALLIMLRREEGRVAEILEPARDLMERYPELSIWRAMLAWVCAELGLVTDARRELDRLAIRDFADVPRDAFWLGTMAALSEVVVLLGDRERAEPLYAMLRPFATRYVVATGVCLGSASRPLGRLATILSRFDDAARHFTDALEMNARLSSRPWVAHTQTDYAHMLLARGEPGDREQALELRARAIRTARELGMQLLLTRATALARDERAEAPATGEPRARVVVFRREGEFWTIADGEVVVRMKDSKGLRYLVQLLGHPGREFYAGDLVAASRGAPPPDVLGDAGPLLDEQSTDTYRTRLAELRESLAEAEANHDAGRAAAAREEIDFLVRELSKAIGLGGRRRRASAPSERARLVVTKAIRASVGKIERSAPRVGRILARTIRTGTFCAYRPDPDAPIDWSL